MALKKQIFFIFFCFIALIFIAKGFNILMFTNTSIACGEFFKEGESRYVVYYKYNYKIKSETYQGSVAKKEIKIVHSIDKLKKMSCIKIEYSNIWPIYSRVIDERILK